MKDSYMNVPPDFGNRTEDKSYALQEAAKTADETGQPVEVWQRIAVINPNPRLKS